MADEDERTAFKIRDELTFAVEALERGDQVGAARCWDSVLIRHPALARDSPIALKLLIGLRRFAEAEAIMKVGQQKHPGDPRFALGLAQIAHADRTFEIALSRWAFVRKRFPGIAEGYTAGANAFMESGQLEAAEALALRAIKQFPDNIGGTLEYARIAMRRQDWEQALLRWRPVRDHFGNCIGFVESANALVQLGRYNEAEATLQEARTKFGNDPGPLCEFARVAEAKGEISEAVQRWQSVLQRFPLNLNVYFNAAEAFERLGDHAEAEAALRAAIDRFPTELRPMSELARFFHFRRNDFSSAAEAWEAIRKVLPNDEESYINGIAALRKSGRLDKAEHLEADYHARFHTP